MYAFERHDGWTVLTKRRDACVPGALRVYEYTDKKVVQTRTMLGKCFPSFAPADVRALALLRARQALARRRVVVSEPRGWIIH
jgi:hypothetical protein